MKQSIAFIVNPKAGGIKDLKQLKKVLKKSTQSHFGTVDVFCTKKASEATDIVKKLKHKYIVAVGGDGTVNEVLNGLRLDYHIFGIVPCGTTNVFAQELKIPSDHQLACNTLIKDKIKKIDIGLANNRRFIMWCGIGFDAHIIAKVPPKLKKLLGPLAYEITAIREVLFYKPPKIHITLDNKKSLFGYFAVITNTRLYGGKIIEPNAKIDDGIFNVVVLTKPDLLHFFKNYLAVSKGKPPKFSDVGLFTAKELFIEAREDASTQLDGEVCGKTPVSIRVLPKSLSILRP